MPRKKQDAQTVEVKTETAAAEQEKKPSPRKAGVRKNKPAAAEAIEQVKETAPRKTGVRKSRPAAAEAAAQEAEKQGPKRAAGKRSGQTAKEPAFITIIQVGDKEFDITDTASAAYKTYKSVHKRKTVTDFAVYIKPEEGVVYYTVNGEGSEDFRIDLQ